MRGGQFEHSEQAFISVLSFWDTMLNAFIVVLPLELRGNL